MLRNRAIVKLSSGVVMSDNTIMGYDQAQPDGSDKERVKLTDSPGVSMAPGLIAIPQNEAGPGNRTSVKRRPGHDKDSMELADDYEIGVKAAENPDKDPSMDVFF